LKSIGEKIENAQEMVKRLIIIIEMIAFFKDDKGETFLLLGVNLVKQPSSTTNILMVVGQMF